jgi:RND family efflux transporter MFP subunit
MKIRPYAPAAVFLLLSFWLSTAQALTLLTVKDTVMPVSLSFDAKIEAVHASTVSSRIAAEVTAINYDVDDIVPKGAVIIAFRDEEFRARVAQMQAAVLADKAQYQEAVARRQESALEEKRMQNLFKRKQITRASLDKAIANLAASVAREAAAQAQIHAREAALEEAKVQLSYTKVIAPYSGIVTERLIELGEMASPGQPLMSGISLDQLRAVVSVPQYLREQVKNANKAELLLSDGRTFLGQKRTLAPAADPRSHSFRVRVDLPANIDNLYPGSYAKLQFESGTQTLLLIPASAIVQRSELSAVYVVKGNSITLRQVRLGREFPGGLREVLAGLKLGEHIATDPDAATSQLKSGD